MTSITVRRTASVVLAVAAFSLLTSCAEAPVSPGDLGKFQEIAATCRTDVVESHQDRVDVSGSGQRAGLTETTRTAIREAMSHVAICGGGIYSLVLFSAGSAHTATVYEDTLSLQGATENAKLRRLPALLDEVTTDIDQKYPEAVASLADGSTDVVSQLSGAAEFALQVPRDRTPAISETVFTDGIGTIGAGALPSTISSTDAVVYAERVTVPDLSGIEQLTFAGIGQVAAGMQPPSSAEVDALKAFYQRLGERTGASTVLVVTEQLNGR